MPAGERIGSIGTSRSTDREPGFDTTRVLPPGQRCRSGAGRCLHLARRKVNPCSLARPAASQRRSSPPPCWSGWASRRRRRGTGRPPRPAGRGPRLDRGRAGRRRRYAEHQLRRRSARRRPVVPRLGPHHRRRPRPRGRGPRRRVVAPPRRPGSWRTNVAVLHHRRRLRLSRRALCRRPSPRRCSWLDPGRRSRPTSAGSTSRTSCGPPAEPGGEAGRFRTTRPANAFGGDFSNGFGQALAILALARTSSGVPASAVDFLLDQQCPGGGFRGDYTTPGGCTADASATVDATGFALQALVTVEPTCAVDGRCTDGVALARRRTEPQRRLRRGERQQHQQHRAGRRGPPLTGRDRRPPTTRPPSSPASSSRPATTSAPSR